MRASRRTVSVETPSASPVRIRPLAGMPPPCAIDHDVAQGGGYGGKKVRPILGAPMRPGPQPQVELVYERCGRRRVAVPYAAPLRSGDLFQLRVHQRNKLIERGLIACTPGGEQLRYIRLVFRPLRHEPFYPWRAAGTRRSLRPPNAEFGHRLRYFARLYSQLYDSSRCAGEEWILRAAERSVRVE